MAANIWCRDLETPETKKRKPPAILERRFVPEGTVIVKQGSHGNTAYLVQSGAVQVFIEHEEKTIGLAKLGVGEIFGEMALIFDEPRTASVKATEDCNLIVITRQAFRQKLDKSDATIRAIVQMFAKRITTSNNALINKKSDLSDLIETTQIIYQNVFAALPRNQQRTFQNAVHPKLEDFVNAIQSFQDRFEE
ncbi:MAG: cyclic nucleotide-binding domain-containing protein [Alphaproteobacteria bacterium]|nr:cyclic nucleotide-binding domain-containing protein [Alphaproteobacteria bacterium]